VSNLRVPYAPPAWMRDMVVARDERDELACLLGALIAGIQRPEPLHPDAVEALLGWVPAARRDAFVAGLRARELVDDGWASEWFGRTEAAE
jgi:hypothetical protein